MAIMRASCLSSIASFALAVRFACIVAHDDLALCNAAVSVDEVRR